MGRRSITRPSRGLAAWALLVPLLAACSDREDVAAPFDASRQRRVFQPPPGEVRAVPPHAILGEGVGPYRLGGSLKDVLSLLPHGPRVELMEIDQVLDYSLMRTERDTILIGVRQAEVSFVSVLDGEIARTQSGAGVGADTSALRAALGPEISSGQVRDPRLLRFASLANARFVVERDRVVAVVVQQADAAGDRPLAEPPPDHAPPRDEGAPARAGAAAPPPGRGRRPAPAAPAQVGATGDACAVAGLAAGAAEIGVAAQIEGSEHHPALITYGCPTSGQPAALVAAGSQMALVAGEAGKFRRVLVDTVPNLVFAGFLDTDGDGRHEVVQVVSEIGGDRYLVRVAVLRIENGRWVRLAEGDAYDVSAASVAWIGAGLDQIELLIEVGARADTVHVGGLYLHRDRGRLLTVAPLVGKKLVVRRKRPPGAPAEVELEVEVDAGAGAPERPRPRPLAAPVDAGHRQGGR